VEAYRAFLTTWLEQKRVKHRVERARLRKGRTAPAQRVTITYGRGTDADPQRVVDVVHDDTARAGDHFKARSVDVLAGDLPYGVQHGARASREASARDLDGLLAEWLPAWFALARPGAAAALAWNRRVLPRPRFRALAEAAGFEVVGADSEALVHRVDRAITRDVLVLRRPAQPGAAMTEMPGLQPAERGPDAPRVTSGT
jgi:hypothetical protein